MKRYMLHPGWIPTSTGGAEYISSRDLARLYKVSRAQCCVYSSQVLKAMSQAEFAQLIHLYPDSTRTWTAAPR